jgi:hypothetical protein
MTVTYEDAMKKLTTFLSDAAENLAFADYQGFKEEAIYKAMMNSGEDFGKILVCCVSLRNSVIEKKLKKRSKEVMELLETYQIKPRAEKPNTITLTRIAVCFPLEYLTVRNMMIKKDKILKIEDVPGDVEKQDFIALNYLNSQGDDEVAAIYAALKEKVGLKGGSSDINKAPQMKPEFIEKIKKAKIF